MQIWLDRAETEQTARVTTADDGLVLVVMVAEGRSVTTTSCARGSKAADGIDGQPSVSEADGAYICCQRKLAPLSSFVRQNNRRRHRLPRLYTPLTQQSSRLPFTAPPTVLSPPRRRFTADAIVCIGLSPSILIRSDVQFGGGTLAFTVCSTPRPPIVVFCLLPLAFFSLLMTDTSFCLRFPSNKLDCLDS